MLTNAGAAYLAAEEAASRAPIIDTVKFASVGHPDPANPPAEDPTWTDITGSLVHTAAVTALGYDPTNPQKVIRTVRLDSTIGDFVFDQVGYFSDTGVLVSIYNLPPVSKRKNDVGQTGNNYKHSNIREFSGSNEAAAVTMPAATWQYDFNVALWLRPGFDVVIGSAAEKAAGQATRTMADIEAAPGTEIPAGSRVWITAAADALTAALTLANANLEIKAAPDAVLDLAGYALALTGAGVKATFKTANSGGGISITGEGSRTVLIDTPRADVIAANGAFIYCTGKSGGVIQRGPDRMPEPLFHWPGGNGVAPARCDGDTIISTIRSGSGTVVDQYGKLKTFAADELRQSGEWNLVEGAA
ncbi:MAG: phage tail protein, partial [Deltaproteobacteria bacterium]|nr:phage tail protein [Deltaproteobacteria bacterium]